MTTLTATATDALGNQSQTSVTISTLAEIGLVISGAEAGLNNNSPATQAFSNANAGTPNTSGYRYEGVTSTTSFNHRSFGYLASQGFKTVKIPVRWERITRNTSAFTPATLNAGEMALLDLEIAQAGSQGLGVIIDLHNYGTYYVDGSFIGQTAGTGYGVHLGETAGGVVMTNAFASLWSALASRYLSNSAVTGFYIMNEPNGQSGGTPKLTQANWYTAAQAAVNAIRAADTAGRYIIRVAGWNWGNVRGWPTDNPSPFITDTVNPVNTWYEAHHYFDQNGSGLYTTYADAVNSAINEGYTTSFQGVAYPDALYVKILSDLYAWKQWLTSAGRKGVVGECGLNNQDNATAADETSWCNLLTAYLNLAGQLDLGVNAYMGGELWNGTNLTLAAFWASNGFTSGVNTAGQNAGPWQAVLA